MLIPLPLAPTLDLRTSASLDWWTQRPAPLQPQTAVQFWETMPPLTLPQFLGLRLGRPTDQVSLGTAISSYKSWRHRGRQDLDLYVLPGATSLWRRTHRDFVFRFDPRQIGRRGLGLANPLRQIAPWARPDMLLEGRYLVAGMDVSVPLANRRSTVRDALRMGAACGYITALDEVMLPPMAFAPSRRWYREHEMARARVTVRHPSLTHQQLAIEAGLALAAASRSLRDLRGIVSETDLASRVRRGTKAVLGTRTEASPDIELVYRDGATEWVELLSADYRGSQIVAKRDTIGPATRYVATSRTVAARAVATAPGLTCYHF